MDPLTAIGLASNILQFISFGASLVSESKQIYHNGTTKEFGSLEELRRCLADITSSLTPAISEDSQNAGTQIQAEIDLNRLATRCKNTALSLEDDMKALRLDDASPSKTASFRTAVKLRFSSRGTDLKKTFEEYQNSLMLCLMSITQNGQSAVLRHLQELRQENLDLVHDHATKLDSVLQAVHSVSQQVKGILQQADDPTLLAPLDKSLKSIMAASSRKLVLEDMVVRSLYFPALPHRFESIHKAHEKTFTKILTEAEAESEGPFSDACPTLLSWLNSENGIYWVSGKPGSGKSTLMKFVATHAVTQEALDRWAGSERGDECVTASYYFWSAGSLLQKSIEGLLRSLLFEILTHVPELIPVILPWIWSSVTSWKGGTMDDKGPRNEWRISEPSGRYQNQPASRFTISGWQVSELSEALQLLSKTPIGSSKRFCFFVDGLDEFDGDHRELVKILTSLSTSPNIKLCVASRPWNIFRDSFGQDPAKMLYVHELTRGDIEAYVYSKLDEEPSWRSECSLDDRYDELVDSITEKAQGVFLWVVLVIRSLMDGLSNGDSLKMLEKRVSDMPEELETFFDHMISSIPKIYHRHMALYFRLVLDPSNTVCLMHLYFLDECLEYGDYAFDLPIRSLSKKKVRLYENIMTRRLSSRCKGLLEANGSREGTWFDSRVELLHRSVRDFLQTRKMAEFLDTLTEDLMPNVLLTSANLACIKSVSPYGPVDKFTALALDVARKAEAENAEMAVDCVDKLHRTLRGMKLVDGDSKPFSHLAIRHRLCTYISIAIDTHKDGFTDVSMLIDVALEDGYIIKPDRVKSVGVLGVLFSRTKKLTNHQWNMFGAVLAAIIDPSNPDMKSQIHVIDLAMSLDFDINWFPPKEVKNVHTPIFWPATLESMLHRWRNVPRGLLEIHRHVIAGFFAHGADPNVKYSELSVWDFFVRTLFLFQSDTVSIARIEFLASVTQMFLEAGARVKQNKFNEKKVHSLFPPHLAEPICQLLRERSERAQVS